MEVKLFEDGNLIEGRVLSYEERTKASLDNGCVLFEDDCFIVSKHLIIDISLKSNLNGKFFIVLSSVGQYECMLIGNESMENDLGKKWNRLTFHVSCGDFK